MSPQPSVTCPKCGLAQDPDHPQCVHMLGSKGGKRGQKTLKERYGTAAHSRAGKRGGLARWAKLHANSKLANQPD